MNMDRFKFRVAIKQEDGTCTRHECVKTIIEWGIYIRCRYSTPNKTHVIDVDGVNVILEQCTGQPDENKKLIFENDRMAFTVFDCYDNETQYVGIVEWIGCEFMLVVSNETVFNLEWVLNQDPTAKIIGNIHESEVKSE